ncbi:MAG: hypothetical protein NTV73_02825 [Hyphomicrobiales bacterium]|nr:hypothetical protein [Hyphomicrobiales bacterium]
MEQRWTVDGYDMPSGDLEFWAIRRGTVAQPANQNMKGAAAGRGRQFLMRSGFAVLVAVAVGIAF